jgi:hypothetical protein
VQEAAGGDGDALELHGLGDHAGGLYHLAGDDHGLGEDGSVQGVGNVLAQGGQGVEPADLGAHHKANEGKHGQAACGERREERGEKE